MKQQYEFFQSLYDGEERTSLQLEGRAKVYLSVITAFLVGLLLKAEDSSKSARELGIPAWGMVAEALTLGISLLCVVFALRIRKFEAINDGVEIIEGFGTLQPTDEEFLEDRIADLAVASSRNRRVNNQTAVALACAGWLLVVSMLLFIGLITYAFWSRT